MTIFTVLHQQQQYGDKQNLVWRYTVTILKYQVTILKLTEISTSSTMRIHISDSVDV